MRVRVGALARVAAVGDRIAVLTAKVERPRGRAAASALERVFLSDQARAAAESAPPPAPADPASASVSFDAIVSFIWKQLPRRQSRV